MCGEPGGEREVGKIRYGIGICQGVSWSGLKAIHGSPLVRIEDAASLRDVQVVPDGKGRDLYGQ
jgi:hypothetical protein